MRQLLGLVRYLIPVVGPSVWMLKLGCCPLLSNGLVSDKQLLCGSRKYPYPPQGRSLEISRGRGISNAKKFKGKYKAKLEIPGGWRVQTKNPSMVVWIFSGTTQLLRLSLTCKLCAINGFVFRCCQSSSRMSQETEFHLNRFKRSCPGGGIGRFHSISCLFGFAPCQQTKETESEQPNLNYC